MLKDRREYGKKGDEKDVKEGVWEKQCKKERMEGTPEFKVWAVGPGGGG